MQNLNNEIPTDQIENLKDLTLILGEIVAECYILREQFKQFNTIDREQFANTIVKKINEILKNEKFVNTNQNMYLK